MKIANVLRRFSFEEWGGTETAVWNAAKIHKDLGHTPELLSTTALCPVESETRDGISIRRFAYFYPHLFLNPQSVLALDKKGGNPFSFGIRNAILSGGFDIVHSHAMGRVAKLARLAARKKGVPFVLSFHGGCYDVPQSEFEEMAKPLKGTLGYGRLVEKILGIDFDLVESADGVICVGENELAEIKARFPYKLTEAIPNGVDCAKFNRPFKADFRAEYGIPKDRILALCVSRIDYQKNQRMLAQMLRALLDRGTNAHVAAIGFATSKSYLEALRADIKKLSIEDRFTVVEGLPPDSDMLLSAYKSADAFVLPSVHEPFGIVALEAWSAGIPLVASAVGGLKHIVRNGSNGYLFSPNSLPEMLAAFDAALRNAPAIAAEASEEVRLKYSWNGAAKRILDFYEEASRRIRP